MKIMTILGTRPEIIRLSLIIKNLDSYCELALVHTGQNYDRQLSDVFFEELGIREPDSYLGVQGATFGEQIANIISTSEKILREVKPDRLLVLGDTNSALSAIVAKRLGIAVYHMEAGNRCFDDRVPEEVNRRIIDHSSDILMPYTERSRMNLLNEGIASQRVFVTGNPIYEVLKYFDSNICESSILEKLDLKEKQYILVTMHREENVDVDQRLSDMIQGLNLLKQTYGFPIICSTHPRTEKRLAQINPVHAFNGIQFLKPFSFFDFVKLEQNAFCVLSDSGTVQEECCIFRVPNVTLRDVTERPETIECGSNILSGSDPTVIERAVEIAVGNVSEWSVPVEYLEKTVSSTVTKIVLGYSETRFG